MGVDLEEVVTQRDRLLEAIRSAARADRRVRAVLLVGSLAAGTADAYSDIDVVVIPERESVDALLGDRRKLPAQFGDVVLQLDSSWNVWSGASQVLTLFDGELPLWVDMDIWPPGSPGTPADAGVLEGDAPPRIDIPMSELATELKERHGVGQVASDNVDGVLDVAGIAWFLKGLARGDRALVGHAREALERPWHPQLERARDPLRRYADHLGLDERGR